MSDAALYHVIRWSVDNITCAIIRPLRLQLQEACFHDWQHDFYRLCPSRGKSISLKATGDICPPLLPSLPRAEYFLHVLRR